MTKTTDTTIAKKVAEKKTQPRVMSGTVISDATDKTITVEVVTVKVHPKYKKRYRITSKYLAHDEKNSFKVGDLVTLTEHTPFSKRKRWMAHAHQPKAQK